MQGLFLYKSNLYGFPCKIWRQEVAGLPTSSWSYLLGAWETQGWCRGRCTCGHWRACQPREAWAGQRVAARRHQRCRRFPFTPERCLLPGCGVPAGSRYARTLVRTAWASAVWLTASAAVQRQESQPSAHPPWQDQPSSAPSFPLTF